ELSVNTISVRNELRSIHQFHSQHEHDYLLSKDGYYIPDLNDTTDLSSLNDIHTNTAANFVWPVGTEVWHTYERREQR
ncbi:unnamed protein product, partial [Didymodactylos carnosus]